MSRTEKPTVEVTENLTRRVAELARLELTDEEVRTYTEQLKDILHYIQQLGEANIEGVEPMVNPLELETPLREDRAEPSPRTEDGHPKSIRNAPEILYDGFKVPPII